MIVATIDLGTNSFKCMIATVKENKLKILFDNSQIVRIGQGVAKEGFINNQSLEKAAEVLSFFKQKIDEHKVQKIKAVTTSAVRDSKNSNEFIKLTNKYGIDVDVISGEQEAILAYNSAVYSKPYKNNCTVIDIGGGSTEITYKKDEFIFHSLNIGAVTLTEKHILHDPITQNEIENLSFEIKNHLSKIKKTSTKYNLGIGGTIYTLLELQKEFNLTQDTILLQDIVKIFKKLSSTKLEDRMKIKGLHPKRADIIIAGNLILIEILKYLGINRIEPSYGGIRLALAIQLLFNK